MSEERQVRYTDLKSTIALAVFTSLLLFGIHRLLGGSWPSGAAYGWIPIVGLILSFIVQYLRKQSAKPGELTLGQRFMYAAGEMGVSLSPSIIVGWLLYFYVGQVDEAGHKIYYVGLAAFAGVNFVGRLVDSVADPFVGYLSDRFHTRWGRRIPWVVLGAPFLSAFSIMLWYPPAEPGSWWNVLWLVVGLGGFWFFFTAVVAPYLSLLPEITFDNDERIETSTYMGYFDVLGLIVATIVLGILITVGLGKPDLITSHPDRDSVSIRFDGEPEETADDATEAEAEAPEPAFYWDEPVEVEMGRSPLMVAIADFNNDDVPDLAAVNPMDNCVSVRLGLGKGAFGERRSWAVGDSPMSLAVDDVNGDGNYDLVTANPASSDITVRLGDGQGGFALEKAIYLSGREPLRVVTADLNRDELPDIALTYGDSGDVSVFLSKGDGGFADGLDLSMGRYGAGGLFLAVGDINKDDYPDLIVSNTGNNEIVARLGNEGCTFEQMVRFKLPEDGVTAWSRDLDRDGLGDIVVPVGEGQPVRIVWGAESPGDNEITTADMGPNPAFFVLNDLDDDGVPDLAAANLHDVNVSLRVGVGDRTFEELQLVPMAGPVFDLKVADLDGGGVTVGPIHFKDGYKFAAWILGIAMMLFFWISVLRVREKPVTEAKIVPYKFWEAFGYCLKNPAFWPYVASVSFFRVAIDMLVAMIPFMVTVIMGFGEDVAGILQGSIVLGALPLFVLVYKWSSKVGKKKVYLLANLVFALALPFLITMKSFPVLGWFVNWVITSLGGPELSYGWVVLSHLAFIFLFVLFPIASVFVLPRALFADIVDKDEELTGYRREAMYNGMEGLITKFAAGLSGILATGLLAVGDTFDNPWGILLAGPVAGVLLLGGYIAFRRYPIEK